MASPLTIQPATSDVQISQNNPTTNYNGIEPLWEYANSGSGNTNSYRDILKFDFSALPAGATITAAELDLYYFNVLSNDAVGRTIQAYRLTQTAWTEAGATWNKYDGTNNWSTAGGDYTVTNGASSVVPASSGWMTWDVTTLAQYFQANTGKIAYFIIRDNDENIAPGRGCQFHSSEYVTDVTLCPKLIITYTTTVDYTLSLSPGSFVITGSNIGTATTLSMNAAPGSLAITGADIGTKAVLSMIASPGAYTITGSPLGFAWKKFIQRLLGLKFGANLHYRGGSKPD